MKQSNRSEDKKITSCRGTRIWQIDLTLLMIPVIMLNIMIESISYELSMITILLSAAGYLLLRFWAIPAYFRNYYCITEPGAVIINSGFFIYRRTRIRFSSIQYCMVSQGYVQKAYQSCSLILMLAGSSVRIRHISMEEAKLLKAKIERYQENNKNTGTEGKGADGTQ